MSAHSRLFFIFIVYTTLLDCVGGGYGAEGYGGGYSDGWNQPGAAPGAYGGWQQGGAAPDAWNQGYGDQGYGQGK